MRAESVGTRPQVGDGAEKLEGNALLLDGIRFRVAQPCTVICWACTSVACPWQGIS